VLMDAEEYAKTKRPLAEIEDTLQKIARGDAAYRQGRTKTLRSLSDSVNGMARPITVIHFTVDFEKTLLRLRFAPNRLFTKEVAP